MQKKSYHHGNLREALIEAAHLILADDGVEGLSLRKVARKAGVSAPALYSHFKDKRELLAVLATQGFERLTAAMAANVENKQVAHHDPEPDLPGLALGYVNFSIQNASLFRLMFGREVGDLLGYPALVEAGSKCYALMADSVAAHLKRSGSPDDPAIAATAAWSLVHGLSTLIGDGRVSAAACAVDSNEALITRVCQTLRFGGAGEDPGNTNSLPA